MIEAQREDYRDCSVVKMTDQVARHDNAEREIVTYFSSTVVIVIINIVLHFSPPPKKIHLEYRIKITYHTAKSHKSIWRQCIRNNE